MEQFGAELAAPDFVQRVDAAIADPTTQDAKALANKVNRHVLAKARLVPYSAAARRQSCSTLYAYTAFYGLPSVRALFLYRHR